MPARRRFLAATCVCACLLLTGKAVHSLFDDGSTYHALAPWGRNSLFSPRSRSTGAPLHSQCHGRGHLVGSGALDAECVCNLGYAPPSCERPLFATKPSFAISHLIYGEAARTVASVLESMRKTRASLATRFDYDFLLFVDSNVSVALARLLAAEPRARVKRIVLPVHRFHGACTCAPYGALDSHCFPDDVAYRGMALFRAVHQFELPEFAEYTYVIVMDAEAHFTAGGDPFAELVDNDVGFAFYAWGAINALNCMGDVRGWSIEFARRSGIDTLEFEAVYGVARDSCARDHPTAPAVCCGVRVSSFSGDVVAFRTAAMRTAPVRRMLRAWSETSFLRENRSTEQELWPNLFGLLFPRAAIHQFSPAIGLRAHIGYVPASTLQCPSGYTIE